MIVEHTESGVLLFPEVRAKLPPSLNKADMEVLEGIQAGYAKQKKTDFFPFDMTPEMLEEASQKDRSLLSNNLIIRWKYEHGSRKLVPFSYRRSSFRRIFEGITDGLERRKRCGWRKHDNLIAEEAHILEEGFQTGDTDRAMLKHILLREHPVHCIWAGFLDRNLHPLKFGLQGWDGIQDPSLSEGFTFWAREVLRSEGRTKANGQPIHVGFLFCDAAGQAGMMTDKELNPEGMWTGNTLPSQVDVAVEAGYKIYFFDNISAWKTGLDVVPVFDAITPASVKKGVDLESIVTRGRRALVAGHEIGHAAHVIPAGTETRLLDMYQTLREAFSEGFEPYSVLTYPKSEIVREDELEAVTYLALARAEVKIRKHRRRLAAENRSWEKIIDPYPYGKASLINTALESRMVDLRDNGMYLVKDLHQLQEVVERYKRELQELTNTGSRDQVEDFILSRSSNPVQFFTG